MTASKDGVTQTRTTFCVGEKLSQNSRWKLLGSTQGRLYKPQGQGDAPWEVLTSHRLFHQDLTAS